MRGWLYKIDFSKITIFESFLLNRNFLSYIFHIKQKRVTKNYLFLNCSLFFTNIAYSSLSLKRQNHLCYLYSLLNISPRVIFDNNIINEPLFLAGKHTHYSTIGQILGKYIFKNNFSTNKDKYISRITIANYIKRSNINAFFPLG